MAFIITFVIFFSNSCNKSISVCTNVLKSEIELIWTVFNVTVR